jgi:hypothetical protein
MEHRCGQRHLCALDVRLVCWPATIGVGVMRNMSISGVYIETQLEVQPLSRVRVNVELPSKEGARKFAIAACVVRTDGRGIGMEWVDMEAAGIREILEHISAQPMTHPLPRVYERSDASTV